VGGHRKDAGGQLGRPGASGRSCPTRWAGGGGCGAHGGGLGGTQAPKPLPKSDRRQLYVHHRAVGGAWAVNAHKVPTVHHPQTLRACHALRRPLVAACLCTQLSIHTHAAKPADLGQQGAPCLTVRAGQAQPGVFGHRHHLHSCQQGCVSAQLASEGGPPAHLPGPKIPIPIRTALIRHKQAARGMRGGGGGAGGTCGARRAPRWRHRRGWHWHSGRGGHHHH
jgi:hypothetical protein